MEILKSKVVIFGSSGHAKSLVDIIESDPNFELVGFIDNLKLKGDEVLNYKVIGEEKSLPELMSEYGFEHGVVDEYSPNDVRILTYFCLLIFTKTG